MKVTALIPTYNRLAQISRAIDSVLAQTYPVSEVIVVDDGSTDGTADFVEQKYGWRVRLFRQPNSGVSAARNHGIREARGEWIAFLDSDDWWHPEKIEKQFAAIGSYGGAPGVCFTNNVYGGHPEMTFSRFDEVGFGNAPAIGMLDDTAALILEGREPFFTSSFLIQRNLLLKVGGFDQSLAIREDTDIFFRLCFKTPFSFVGEPLTEIDRTPSRSLGLCKMYSTRDDTVFDCSDRIFFKWLAMPEVKGTRYEATVRELLREVFYASAECKIHDMRMKSALRDIGRLKVMGEGVGLIMAKLLARKMRKMKRNWGRLFSSDRTEHRGTSLGVAE